MRKSVILWLVLATLCGGLLFQTSQRVNDGRTKLSGIETAARKEEEHMRVLEAEWSYLNQPDRLEKLSKQYLSLAPLKGRQFAKLEDVPMRPVDAPVATDASDTPPEPAPAIVTGEEEKTEPAIAPEKSAEISADENPPEEKTIVEKTLAETPKPTAPLLKSNQSPAAAATAAAAQKWQPTIKAKPQTGLIWSAPPPKSAARNNSYVWSAPQPKAAPRPAYNAPAPAYMPPVKPAAQQPPQLRRSFGELMKSLGVQ